MMFYLWGERGKRARGQKDYVTNYLRKSYKMTWRILGGDEEWLISNGTGGIFYLDNIRIYPSSIFMSQVNNNKISRPTITCVKDETFLNSTIFSDFLGRKIEISKNHTISNLPFVYRNYQKSNKKVLRLK
ncbi:MAG: hypothetical protein N2053_11785 [Chitinispirillaceae bacterium]|nr:hypothetical protein [Chitinispirillaceae bacterium]